MVKGLEVRVQMVQSLMVGGPRVLGFRAEGLQV